MARNPFDETNDGMNGDLLEWLRSFEERIGKRFDRHEDVVERKFVEVHSRIADTNKKVSETREEFAGHRGKMTAFAIVVGTIVSAVVSVAARFVQRGGE